jgi:hypothetical protein
VGWDLAWIVRPPRFETAFFEMTTAKRVALILLAEGRVEVFQADDPGGIGRV